MTIHVLIIKTSSMGDVLHTLPALTDAMNLMPGIKFDWVVEENFTQIPTWHPAVVRVFPIAIRRWRKNWFSKQNRLQRQQFYQQLQQRQYDAVIDAQGLLKSAVLIARKARGIRHGLDWQSAREPLASLFYNEHHRVAKNQHAVERIRQLFAQSLGYKCPNGVGNYAIANQVVQRLIDKSANYLVFLHSTTRANKHWPEQHWRALLLMMKSLGLQVKLPWGTPEEHARAIRLASGLSYVSVMDKLTLSEVAELLADSQGVVSVDTGLSHLTAALDKPNITLYGPTDPGLIGGYGKHQLSLLSPDTNMASIKPEQVFETIKQHILHI